MSFVFLLLYQYESTERQYIILQQTNTLCQVYYINNLTSIFLKSLIAEKFNQRYNLRASSTTLYLSYSVINLN